MSIVDTDSDLPPDVTFLVAGEDGKSSIKAHKWPLAGVSPVFRKQFLGPMKDERDAIEVEQTTAEAFQTMVDFIYRKAGLGTFTVTNINCPQLTRSYLNLLKGNKF